MEGPKKTGDFLRSCKMIILVVQDKCPGNKENYPKMLRIIKKRTF